MAPRFRRSIVGKDVAVVVNCNDSGECLSTFLGLKKIQGKRSLATKKKKEEMQLRGMYQLCPNGRSMHSRRQFDAWRKEICLYLQYLGMYHGVCWTHGAKRELKRCRLQGMCTKFVKKGGFCITHGAKVVGRGNCAQLCRVAPTKSEREECKPPSRECSKFRHEGRSL